MNITKEMIMYPNQPMGVVGAGALGAPKQQTELEGLHDQLRNAHSSIHEAALRINNALDRISPCPKDVANTTAPEPNPSAALHRLSSAIKDVSMSAKWLHELAERLERIG